ncbi:hypothetical protein [Nonomuraea rosea]|uniref:hypothetical protein n=1 Tax=Nonomuraea rosea TaxID=638574 RepID=UPI0031E90B9F
MLFEQRIHEDVLSIEANLLFAVMPRLSFAVHWPKAWERSHEHRDFGGPMSNTDHRERSVDKRFGRVYMAGCPIHKLS